MKKGPEPDYRIHLPISAMGGILKNPLPANQSPSDGEESISEFRKQVLMNTQLNAKLTSKKEDGNTGMGSLHVIPKDTLSLKRQQEAEERLQWNQKNLAANEVTKQQYQDIHIDEPKTPYQGAIDPNGEYYKDDDEDEEELDNFSLEPGSSAPAAAPKRESETSSGDLETVPPTNQDNEHTRRFEEMRKKHYNLKEALQSRRLNNNDYDEDEDDQDDLQESVPSSDSP